MKHSVRFVIFVGTVASVDQDTGTLSSSSEVCVVTKGVGAFNVASSCYCYSSLATLCAFSYSDHALLPHAPLRGQLHKRDIELVLKDTIL